MQVYLDSLQAGTQELLTGHHQCDVFFQLPEDLELISNKFAHDPMNPHVCGGIKVFAIHDPNQWLMVSHYCKFGPSQV